MLSLQIGRKVYPVDDIPAASALYCQERDKSGKGASTWPDGLLSDAVGQFVGRISYNGKVWPLPQWAPGDIPTFTASRSPS